MTSSYQLRAGTSPGVSKWWKNYIKYLVSVHGDDVLAIIKNHMEKDLHDNWNGTLKTPDRSRPHSLYYIATFSDEQSMAAFLLRFG